jgi:hypothetical protein
VAADDLVVGISVDPTGISRGIVSAIAEIKRFEAVVRQIDKQTGQALDIGALGAVSAKAFRDTAASAAAYEARIRGATEAVFGLSQANSEAFASQVRASTGAARWAAGLDALRTQQIQAINYTGRWTAGLNALAAQQAATAASLTNLGTRAQVVAGHQTRLGHSTSQTAQHFVTMAAAGLGADTAIARMAANVLALSVGFGKVTIGAGIVFALAKAWEVFTAGQREAEKATKDNTEALKHLQEQQKGPVAAAQSSFDIQRREVERLSLALANLSKQQHAATDPTRFGRLAVPSLDPSALAGQRVNLLKQLTAASDLLAVAARGVGDAETDAGEKARRAHEQAREAAKRHLDALLEIQHATRVANAGGGNLPAGAGGINQGPFVGGLLSGATADQITESRGRVADATAEAARQTTRLALSTQQWAIEEDAALRASEAAFQVERIEKFTNALHGTMDVAFALGDAFGIMDGALGQALKSAENLADAIAHGNVFGAISSGIDLIGSLFKESKDPERFAQNERWFEAAMQGSAEALEQLRIHSTVSRPGMPGWGSAAAAADAQAKYQAALMGGAASVRGLADAADAAAAAMRNIPTGFRVEASRFAAQTPESPGPITVTRPNIDPGRRTGNLVTGNSITIVIDGAGKNSREIAQEVRKALEKDSMATHGHPDASWGGAKWPG